MDYQNIRLQRFVKTSICRFNGLGSLVMATISFASAKGGVGKSSLAILIGSELALAKGWKVALLDSDLNQHSAAFGTKATIPGFIVIGDITEDNILPTLRKAEVENEIVIIDLAGGSSTLALMALQRSHFVLVPVAEPHCRIPATL